MAGQNEIRLHIQAAKEEFQLQEGELRALLTRGPDAIVYQDLARRAVRVQNAAKLHATDRPGPRVRTGRLRGSITWRLGADAHGPYADVGSAVHYALYVEMGHNVVRAGRVVGHARPYPFLRPALAAAR